MRRPLLLAAGIAIALSVALVTVTADDVSESDGLVSSDPSRLRFFIDHRTDLIVSAAKFVTNLGTAPILGLLALVAGVVLWWRGAHIVVAVAPALSLSLA